MCGRYVSSEEAAIERFWKLNQPSYAYGYRAADGSSFCRIARLAVAACILRCSCAALLHSRVLSRHRFQASSITGKAARSEGVMSGYMSKRGYTWRYWVLQVALVGFVVLSSMSASHDHKSAAESLACAPCHVGGQGTLDVPPVGGEFVNFEFSEKGALRSAWHAMAIVVPLVSCAKSLSSPSTSSSPSRI